MMQAFVHSIELSLLITCGIALLLCLAGIPRLYTVWKSKRRVSLSMPFHDAEELRFRVAEALKFVGKPTPSTESGSFVIEPSNWRKKLGLRPIAVSVVHPQLALISGQGPVLNGLAKSQQLLVEKDPTDTFLLYLKRQTTWFSWTILGFFVLIFAAIMVHTTGEARYQGRKIVPVEQPYNQPTTEVGNR